MKRFIEAWRGASRIDRSGFLLAVVTAVVAVALNAGLDAKAGNQEIKRYSLFYGVSQVDSTEVASPWIPVRGASKIYIRTWSAASVIDTDFCDTITTFKTLFSDSVLFIARDSLGTIVTARSGIPRTSAHGPEFPMCADSVMISNNGADSVKMVTVIGAAQGVAKLIRGSASGSGIYTIIVPSPAPGGYPLGGVNLPNTGDFIMPQYMRIRVLPRTRNTTAGFVSTQGLRTRGINKLRMEAIVVFENK